MSDHEKTMKKRADVLQHYVSDMVAVEDQINSAVKRQLDDSHLRDHSQDATRIIQKIAQLSEQHHRHLQERLKHLGGDPASGIKEAATNVMGTLAGLYDRLRSESVSKMLRDNYTALNLATVSYTMLHTTGLALQDEETAELALRHLRHYAEMVLEINRIIPRIVVEDLREDVAIHENGTAQRAIENTQQAWQIPSSDLTTF